MGEITALLFLSRPKSQETRNKNQHHCFTGSYGDTITFPQMTFPLPLSSPTHFFLLLFFALVCQVIPTSHFSQFLRLASCVTCVLDKVTHFPPSRPSLFDETIRPLETVSSLSSTLIVTLPSVSHTPPPCLRHSPSSCKPSKFPSYSHTLFIHLPIPMYSLVQSPAKQSKETASNN